MARQGLGELEHQTMLALLRLKDDVYTAPIAEELERRTGRRTTTAAVYIVLRRLEEKGLVESVLQDPGAEGGRDRRYFEVTDLGLQQLRQARAAYTSLWEGLDTVLAKG
ncbi:MAG: PadR family transcriptional regulator [Gemmatimonadota bacterium]|nr:PadR family transcriptional regulator [Gemmatimonadota bacterium]